MRSHQGQPRLTELFLLILAENHKQAQGPTCSGRRRVRVCVCTRVSDEKILSSTRADTCLSMMLLYHDLAPRGAVEP